MSWVRAPLPTPDLLVAKGRSVRSGLFHQSASILGCSQVVRHGTLTPALAGSSPAIPAKLLTPRVFIINEYDSLAQLVEQRPFKAKVRGSSPRRVTTKTNFARRARLVFVIFRGREPRRGEMPARRRVFRSATAALRRLLARRCPRRVTTSEQALYRLL